MSDVPSRVVDHAHCEMCGRVVRFGDRVCGEECQEKLDAATREKKRSVYLLVAMIAAAVLLSVLLR